MDAALKARNLGSAAARRRRIQERKTQQQAAHQEMLERKKNMMEEVYSASGSEDESDVDTSSNPDLDSSTGTPSESSARTPEDKSSPGTFIHVSPELKLTKAPEMVIVKDDMDTSNLIPPKSAGLPKMQATLTTIADWNYDRFSIFVDPSEVEEMLGGVAQEEQDKEDASSSENEDVVEYSPIEIATPVSYIMPKARPAMVRITSAQSHNKSFNFEPAVAKQPQSRRHVSEQLSLNSTSDASHKKSASLFHESNSSRETLASTYASSQVSRAMSSASHNDGSISRSFSQTSQSDQSHRSPKKKSSLPLLFGNNKTGHSRMSSIKKLIRTSTLGPPSANYSTSNLLQRMPSSATLATHFESPKTSMEIARDAVMEHTKRPMTARLPSPPSSPIESTPPVPTTLPPAIPTSSPAAVAAPTPNRAPAPPKEPESIPTKPVSKFRSRSGSFGHALKSIGSGTRKTEASAPPVPALFIPPPPPPNEENLAYPPPLTPKTPRRSVTSYSPFPTAPPDRKIATQAVGLGLRY